MHIVLEREKLSEIKKQAKSRRVEGRGNLGPLFLGRGVTEVERHVFLMWARQCGLRSRQLASWMNAVSIVPIVPLCTGAFGDCPCRGNGSGMREHDYNKNLTSKLE